MFAMSATLVSVNVNKVQEQLAAAPSSSSTNASHGSTHDGEEPRDVRPEHDGSSSEKKNLFDSCAEKPEIGGDESKVCGESTPKAGCTEADRNDGQVGACAAAIEEDGDTGSSSSVLPVPLQSILSEVATTGESSSLTWDSVRKNPPSESLCASKSNKRGFIGGSPAVAPIAIRPRVVASYMAPSSSSSAKAASASAVPPRKKQRNGIHGTAHRKSRPNRHRKRPLRLIRATATATTTVTGANMSVASPAPSARFSTSTTSGSEPEDTSQYDSEGTSTTSNSELSFDQQHRHLRHSSQHLNLRSMNSSSSKNANWIRTEGTSAPSYASSLREAFRVAIGLVLDAWFQNKGGYVLSPAERKIHKDQALAAKDIFLLRKDRLLKRLGLPEADPNQKGEHLAGPPFTIQRIAEVLVTPEKYYTQTHKLCNCLEKLLLVSSPTSAFGGSQGGITSQSRREEQELAALADERVRIQSEFRQLRRRRSSLASDSGIDENILAPKDKGMSPTTEASISKENSMGLDSMTNRKKEDGFHQNGHSSDLAKGASLSSAEAERREQLEAAARASLRSKFDHVGIDPHHQNHSLAVNPNTKAIADSRSLTNSPPPPNLAAVPNLSGGLLRSPHATPPGEHPSSPVRSLSPILFNDISSPTTPPQALPNPSAANMHILQMHHAAAVAGVSPFELMALGTGASSMTASATAGALLGTAQLNSMKEQDVESRSSASSDVDSESDDISFDDSASDRSDGSDSGFVGSSAAAVAAAVEGAPSSNFSAVARAMALKRHQHSRTAATTQQQQQQPQPRTSQKLAPSALVDSGLNGLQEPAVPSSASAALMANSEEMVPEDSDVSDSSLSDMAE